MPYQKNKRCIYEYCNEICEYSECSYCPYYRPNYKEEKELFYDLLMEQQEQA